MDKLILWTVGLLIIAIVGGLLVAVLYHENQLHQPVKGEIVETWFEPA